MSTTTANHKPTLRFCKPNGRGTGSAIEFKFYPATENGEGEIFVSIAQQVTNNDIMKFDFDNAYVFKLRFENVCRVLQVIRGETESLYDLTNKGIVDDYGTVFSFRHCVEGEAHYEFHITYKSADENYDDYDVRFEMNTAQALGLCVVLEDCLPKMAFGA